MNDCILILDTETGGFSEERDALLQVGAILLDSELNELGTFVGDCLPWYELNIGSKALEVQGRTYQDLAKQPTPEEYELLQQLEDFVALYDSESPPVFGGYSCGFDLKFMSAAYARHGFAAPYVVPERTGPVDALVLAKRRFQKPRDVVNHKLTTVAEYCGVLEKNAHNALVDCRMTAGVLRFIRNLEQSK